MISPTACNRLAVVLTVVGLGILGGCTMEGDTYSGTVVNTDCSNASSAGGQLNCGSGNPHDDHSTEEIAAE